MSENENIPQTEKIEVPKVQLEKLIHLNKSMEADIKKIMSIGKQVIEIAGLSEDKEISIVSIMTSLPKLKKNAHVFEEIPALIEKYKHLLENGE